jgi:NDP-sugar pyrophosphorylase family protein
MNILIPLEGKGKRFIDAGYKIPKPLIDVDGKTMIEKVLENVPVTGQFIFVISKQQVEEHSLDKYLLSLIDDAQIVITDGVLKGAAHSCLRAGKYINNSTPLMTVNCDLIDIYRVEDFNNVRKNVDGMIFTFNSTLPSCSFVRLNQQHDVVQT